VIWRLNPILTFITIRQPTRFFVLYRWDLSKIPKLHVQCDSWPLLDGLALYVNVSYDTRWIFHWFSSSSMLVFRSSWVRFAFSACNRLTSLKSVPCVISSMTVLEVSATPGIVTTEIGSWANISAGCPWGGVVCISNRQRGTEFNLWSSYHSRSSPTMLWQSLCAKITHSTRVFPHRMDSGNPITTFGVTNLQRIAVATEVKVFPRPISSATSAPGISAFWTHLLTMNQMGHTWCARNLVPGRPGIEYLWPGTRLSVDWRIRCAFSSQTASSNH